MTEKINKQEDFKEDDEKFYFPKEENKSSAILYVFLVFLLLAWSYMFKLNWENITQYNKIVSEERYPIEIIDKDQIAYFGNNYEKFKNESKVNTILSDKELEDYWRNCIGSCEIPPTYRLKLISKKQAFINWVCNERVKEEKYTATKYAMWKFDGGGCVLTNLEEVKEKDKNEIKKQRWEKQKEMTIYLVLSVLMFLMVLSVIIKIVKRK